MRHSDDEAKLVAARDNAMKKVRAWWDAEQLAGRFREHTDAPAWQEYLNAFAALEKVRESEEENNATSG